MLNIHELMQGLAKTRPVFHSEADFQFALAWHIKETMPDCEVRLEWKPFPKENLHIDAWLPTYATAIELKYPTRAPFGVCHNGERFKLAKHPSPRRRYSFVKDIERIERILYERDDIERGFAVLLTNRKSLWQDPRPDWECTDDAAFRLHEGRKLSGELSWRPGSAHLKNKRRKHPIRLRNTYPIQWSDFSSFCVQKNSQFRYLAVEVGK